MGDRKRFGYIAIILSMILVASFLIVGFDSQGQDAEIRPAPDFTATDHLNRSFSLSDMEGQVTILHITQFESPVCMECEDHMREQIEELKILADEDDPNISIITLNIRKNSYSDDGWALVEQWYGINITWHWIEEFEPFPIASQYQEYWEVDSSFANPSIIMIDQDQDIVGVYHVYCLGSGELDGTQTHDSLASDADDILSGEWGEFRGEMSDGVTLTSMLLLGIITSFSPCSILLLLTMISYIGSMKDEAEDGTSLDLNWKGGLWIGVSFTIGTTLVFLLFGLLISYVGLFIEISRTFYLIAGSILVILGINAVKPFSEIISISKREEDSKMDDGQNVMNGYGARIIDKLGKRSANLASFFLGILFSIGWAPCAISLVFPVIVLMLSQDISLIMGGLMMGLFGLGHGLVIIPFCVASGEMKGKLGNKYINAGKWIQPLFGLAIVIIGTIFALRYFGMELW